MSTLSDLNVPPLVLMVAIAALYVVLKIRDEIKTELAKHELDITHHREMIEMLKQIAERPKSCQDDPTLIGGNQTTQRGLHDPSIDEEEEPNDEEPTAEEEPQGETPTALIRSRRSSHLGLSPRPPATPARPGQPMRSSATPADPLPPRGVETPPNHRFQSALESPNLPSRVPTSSIRQLHNFLTSQESVDSATLVQMAVLAAEDDVRVADRTREELIFNTVAAHNQMFAAHNQTVAALGQMLLEASKERRQSNLQRLAQIRSSLQVPTLTGDKEQDGDEWNPPANKQTNLNDYSGIHQPKPSMGKQSTKDTGKTMMIWCWLAQWPVLVP